MRMRCLLIVLACFGAVTPAAGAGSPPSVLSAATPKVTWTGVVSAPAPLGCGQANLGCDVTALTVQARKGTWITVALDVDSYNLRVTAGGQAVGSGGQSLDGTSAKATTTFQQVATGRVTYQVAVGDPTGNPAEPSPYTATARLAGSAFDRIGDCGPTTGVEHLQDPDRGERLALSVRLVADPKDRAAVLAAGRALAETYRRINIAVRVSYDFRVIRDDSPAYPFEQVRRAYGGVRPKGVDVVHVMTDLFAGGFADCIGGVAYPEKAFSVGDVHYTVQGTVPVDKVPAGMIAAHEIGHLLGAQHQQVNCVEALPQEVASPAGDGWVGPCTVMGPAALNDSETFSTLERATVRAFTRAYARG